MTRDSRKTPRQEPGIRTGSTTESNWEETTSEGESTEVDTEHFLENLRVTLQRIMMKEAEENKKLNLGEYLKLVTVIEERQRTNAPSQKEIVVRWEEPLEEEDAYS